jgi:hypothetical protein
MNESLAFSKLFSGSLFSGHNSTSASRFWNTDCIKYSFLFQVSFIMHINGQSLLTWINIVIQDCNAFQSELFTGKDLLQMLILSVRRKLALCTLIASDSFTERFNHIQPNICLITSSIFYHSKSLTHFIEHTQSLCKLVHCASRDFCKNEHQVLKIYTSEFCPEPSRYTATHFRWLPFPSFFAGNEPASCGSNRGVQLRTVYT